MALFIYSASLTAAMLGARFFVSAEKQPESCNSASTQVEDDCLSEVSLLQTKVHLEPDEIPKLKFDAETADEGLAVMYSKFSTYMQNPEGQKYYHALSKYPANVSVSELVSIYREFDDVVAKIGSTATKPATSNFAAATVSDPEYDEWGQKKIDTRVSWSESYLKKPPQYKFTYEHAPCPRGYSQVVGPEGCQAAVNAFNADNKKFKARWGQEYMFVFDGHLYGPESTLCYCSERGICMQEGEANSKMRTTGARVCEKRAPCSNYTACTGTTPYQRDQHLCTGNASSCDAASCCEQIELSDQCALCRNHFITFNMVTHNLYFLHLCRLIDDRRRGVEKNTLPDCEQCQRHLEVFCKGETPGGHGAGRPNYKVLFPFATESPYVTNRSSLTCSECVDAQDPGST